MIGDAYDDILGGRASLNALSKLKSQMKIEKPSFTTNGNSIKLQNATIQSGDQTINLTFSSSFDPLQVGSPKKAVETKIVARVWKNGNIEGIRTITSTSSKSLKNAEKQYNQMVDDWKKLTGQKTITF